MDKMRYAIGLDIGIGSAGWAVVRLGDGPRIEDFGTRIFESGEEPKTKQSLCQERRSFRGVRRLERRRTHRKQRLKNHFDNIGLTNAEFYDDFAACKDADVYLLKIKGLDQKLKPAELYKCLVHTCNHRGYQDFYESDEDDKESGVNEKAANLFEKEYRESGKRTVSEFLVENFYVNGFVKYRNRSSGDMLHFLIRRSLLRQEVEALLDRQSEYYFCLNKQNRERTLSIIFDQRDFETGPGKESDPSRKYKGFLDTLGKCPYYKNCDRGFRATVISDVYSVTNALSQYRFVNQQTGEYDLDKSVASELINSLLENAGLNKTELKKILSAHGYTMIKADGLDEKALTNAVKYLKTARKAVEKAGLDWHTVISEEQFDLENPSMLHRIGELISKFQTPSRRRKEMEVSGIDRELCIAFSDKRISGMAACSYEYMCDAINAFRNGDIYGNFQASFIKQHEENDSIKRTLKLSCEQIDDPEVRNNRVVFKAINETRKIVNAIIERYGSPEDIVIEVASELGKSIDMRNEDTSRNRANEKASEAIKAKIAELLGIDSDDVKGHMIERYKLFCEQEGKSMYSQKPLGELKDVLINRNHEYETDHIVPYSLILDNTLNNKALVFAEENQKKGQRTPLMYLGNDAQMRAQYLAAVNHLFTRKEDKISKKKLAYFKLETIYSEEAEQILSEWKSRNINDTRYITKYIAGLFARNLIFAGDKKQHVLTVKGAVTQKFRREWFADSKWGDAEKNRDTYLNHALDALVAANLTKPYIEIGSDAIRLISIYKYHKCKITPEYDEYLEKCLVKMKKYYGFDEEYTRKLLHSTDRVPSYIPRLSEEVAVRFCENIDDREGFEERVKQFYGDTSDFTVAPHIPVTSQKQEKKFSGCIADSNLLKLADIDGVIYKITRKPIASLSLGQLERLYTDDESLISQLHEILDGHDEKYTVEKYLKDNGFDVFRTKSGAVIRKVSLREEKAASNNVYRKEIGEDNYSILGGLKYYCIEFYKDKDGGMHFHGIRYIDIAKKSGKLFYKGKLPEDYAEHIMYVYKNDYIVVNDRNGNKKFSGFYQSVANINQQYMYMLYENDSCTASKHLTEKDTIHKYDVSILGNIGGEIKCSEPLRCIKEKESL